MYWQFVGLLVQKWYVINVILVMTRSSAIAQTAARRSVSVEMLSYCCTNNAQRSRVSLRSSFSNCYVLFRYFVNASFNYRLMRACDAMSVINTFPSNQRRWCQLDRNCDHQISTTTVVVDNTAYSSARAPSWTRTTVADGHKFSAIRYRARDFSTGQKTQFIPTSPVFGAPLGVIPLECRRDLSHRETRVIRLLYGVVYVILRLAVLEERRLMTDGLMDRWIDTQWQQIP